MRGPVRLPLEQLQHILFPACDGPLHWGKVFDNDQPVEIEIGFGKGLYLLNASQTRSDVNFFGIEVERKYQLFTANRLAKRNISNVRLACGDAREFLRDRVPAGSVQAIHVYFPDPWWKQRHHKRRLFTEGFAAACVQALGEGAQLHLLSDVEDYFAAITDLLAKRARLRPLPTCPVAADYRTNFERKYRLAGRPVFAASYEAFAEPPADAAR